MGGSGSAGNQGWARRRGPRAGLMAIAVVAGFALAALTGLALASTGSQTIKTAHNKRLGKTIVVEPIENRVPYSPIRRARRFCGWG